MDPNETLNEIRELVMSDHPDAERLVELIRDLDFWIGEGNPLPSDWAPTPPQPTADEEKAREIRVAIAADLRLLGALSEIAEEVEDGHQLMPPFETIAHMRTMADRVEAMPPYVSPDPINHIMADLMRTKADLIERLA
jgi:hypothetical protein